MVQFSDMVFSLWLTSTYCLHRRIISSLRMKWVLVYKGQGMYEEDTKIVLRVMKEYVDPALFTVDTVSAADIIKGRLAKDTALLAIGGGYDLGLIEAMGAKGMKNIKEFVLAGGSYLGICAGAYFACDRIEFDKGGPQEVLGERFLNFYPGTAIGPLFKPYDYQGRKGAAAVNVDFPQLGKTRSQNCQNKYSSAGDQLADDIKRKQSRHNDYCPYARNHVDKGIACGVGQESTSGIQENGIKDANTEMLDIFESQRHTGQDMKSQIQQNESQIRLQSQEQESQNFGPEIESEKHISLRESHLANEKVGESSAENGLDTFPIKVYFNGGCYFKGNKQNDPNNTTVLSRYLDLPDCPVAIVQCQFGAGLAVLSGPHLEYDAWDIDDGDITVKNVIPCLRNSAKQRRLMLRVILKQLNITTK